MKKHNTPVFILVFGLPGTGKTTLARELATTLNAWHRNSDGVRADLDLRGCYSDADKERVYQHLLEEVFSQIAAGKSVIVDATFSREAEREKWASVAQQAGVPVHWIEVRADEDVIRKRVQKARSDSEADESVYQQIRDEWDPMKGDHLILHTDRHPLSDLVGQVLDELTRYNPHLQL